ncbi:MAG: hypothetical protein QME61_02695 [Patescibacteria group bacterium]|nr:hypothetical protein [Patescibacteria group bacterium]
MSLKSISLSQKIFFLSFIIGLTILYLLPTDEFGIKCGSKSFVPFVVILLMVLIPLSALIIERARKRISNLVFGGIFILLILFVFSVGLMILGHGTRCVPSWQRTLADMRQLRRAQEIFYKSNNRYADTQEELISAGILSAKFKNLATSKEFTDRDGGGIEGSDNDPETWLATTHLQYQEIDKWCRVINRDYWFTCNQDGCYKEE